MVKDLVTSSAIVLALMATGCSTENIAERIAEKRIESETGGDVDIDFDDGDISIKTEDGEFSIETDGDGNVSVQGSGSNDGETFNVDSEGGETVIETEDGTATFSQSADLPDDFPESIPLPDDVSVVFSQSVETGDGTGFVVTATTERELDDLAADFIDGLEANGFAQQQLTTLEGGSLMTYTNDDYSVNVALGANAESTTVSMTITPQPGG